MKTLLLTLVVVTIICLDIGDTLVCHKGLFLRETMTCPEGENLCYTKTVPTPTHHYVIFGGCIDSCPKSWDYVCCRTDKCNR
uniref:Three-finger toxin n=1 Tax=Calliophis bivirgatus TaxID=8633 RepID=A0A898IPN4_CALBG|nr:three-finger toxin [Calliophis bivirgatus]